MKELRNPHSGNKTIRIIYFLTLWFFVGLIGYQYLPLGVRAVALETYRIPTESMLPTLIPGDKVLVNKLIIGPRWYSDLDSVSTHNPGTIRLWGWRNVKHNDVLVFNMPYPYSRDKIEFKINYVFCKRCIGLPGDSISIVNGFYKNSNTNDTLGNYANQKALSETPDQYMEYMFRTFPHDTTYNWNVRHFGPLYIPKKGTAITIDTLNYILYRLPIEYETGQKLRKIGGKVLLNSTPVRNYTFQQNYYFMAGDNVLSSEDSRVWGFVPDKHIVGVVTRILYSKAPTGDKWDKSRLFKTVK